MAPCIDLRARNACLFQHPQIGLNQIKVCPAIQAGTIREQVPKLRRHLGAHFETARADARPDRRQQTARLRSETPFQVFDGAPGDACHGSAPSGVYGGNGPRVRVHQKQRQAIRRLDAQKQTRLPS